MVSRTRAGGLKFKAQWQNANNRNASFQLFSQQERQDFLFLEQIHSWFRCGRWNHISTDFTLLAHQTRFKAFLKVMGELMTILVQVTSRLGKWTCMYNLEKQVHLPRTAYRCWNMFVMTYHSSRILARYVLLQHAGLLLVLMKAIFKWISITYENQSISNLLFAVTQCARASSAVISASLCSI